MDIKKFLESEYSYENFKKFIFDKFYGFEENNIDYEEPDTNIEQKHILKYKFMGSCQLDDKKEIGFFEVITTEKTDIENNRVSLGNILKNKASNELLDSAIAVFYNPNNPSVWRLSFIKFSYDENDKQQVSNLKRFTYVLGKNIPIKTAYNQLKNLKYPSLIELEEAFSVDKVTKEFFINYKDLYFKLVKDLTVVNQKNITQQEEKILEDNKQVSFYIKKLLGRIVFLYFVQKKGWLNSDRKFLSNLFYNFTKENPNINFYDEILEDLFFNALNTKRNNDKINLGGNEYEIPYLNGGLFEEDEYDKTDLTITNENLKQVLELFDSYNFTVIEDTPHDSEIAIDPEMLGRVFEDLLEDRKEKGAFYTPREIVHYMCQQSIINYLLNFYGEDNLEDIKSLVIEDKTDTKFIRNNAKDIKKYLEDIKVLDPAIGSGAFPMGMLHEIVAVLSNLDKTADIGQLKRKVIENSIYGVDIEHSAVEIAKLRFWLSIVVDEEKPTPLPNLSYKIMVGNSLIETINGFDPLEISKNNKGNGERIKRMKDKFHSYFNSSSNEEKNIIKKDIEKDVDDIFIVALRNYQNKLEEIISKNDLLNTNASLRKKHNEQLQNISLIKKIQKEYEENRFTTELFLYKIYFAEVLENGGFDVVIGNPPYVRQEKIKELKSKQEIQNFKSYNGTADLYIYFFEKGFKLLKEKGILSFITSNKYTRAKYGKEFREFVLENSKILEYIDFNGVKVFESATVDTSILNFQKIKSKNIYFNYCDIDITYKKGSSIDKFINKNGWKYNQSDLSIDSFSFSNPKELRIKKQIERIGIPLKDWDIKIYRGILTGLNEAFIIDTKTKNELIAKNAKSAEIIKPLLRGRDIKRYRYAWAGLWLINSHNNPPIDMSNYPAIKEHLDQFYSQLEKRSDKGKTPYNLRNCAYLEEFEKEKIIQPQTVKEQSFCFDNKGIFGDVSMQFWISKNKTANIKFILAFANSKVFNFYMRKTAYSFGETGTRWIPQFLLEVPIPKVSENRQKIFEILVDYILFTKEQELNKEALLFEAIIDGMVYDSYFEEDMKKADCFITSRVEEIVKPFGKYDNDEFKKELVKVIYAIFREDKTLQRGLIYSRNIEVVKIINGDKKND